VAKISTITMAVIHPANLSLLNFPSGREAYHCPGGAGAAAPAFLWSESKWPTR
jgi:hypothetical protein